MMPIMLLLLGTLTLLAAITARLSAAFDALDFGALLLLPGFAQYTEPRFEPRFLCRELRARG